MNKKLDKAIDDMEKRTKFVKKELSKHLLIWVLIATGILMFYMDKL